MKRGETRQVFLTLGLASLVSAGFFLVRALSTGSSRYIFLLWNLALAWVPLGFAAWLSLSVRQGGRKFWQNLALGLAWLVFLPNSFYLVSDFVHLHATYEISLLYDAAMMTSFAFSGLALGFLSLYLVHRWLIERLGPALAHFSAAAVLAMCSFAIYLGRYQRWNSWDVLVDPAGLLFDLSDQIINPAAHTQGLATAATFFVLLGTIYVVAWRLGEVLKRRP